MRRLLAVALLLGTFGLAGCATATPQPAPAPTGSAGLITPIAVIRQGGLAGQRQWISVQADGAWTFTDAKAGTTSHGQLTPAQAQTLVTALTDPALTKALANATPTVICSDGFEYMLQFSAADTFTFFDCGGMDPALSAVIDALAADTPF